MQVDETKITKLLFAIVLAFTSCWSPLIVIDGVSMFRGGALGYFLGGYVPPGLQIGTPF